MAFSDTGAIAVIVGACFIPALYTYIAFKLSKARTHESIGLFLLLMAFVQTILVSTLIVDIASESAVGAAITNEVANYYLVVIITFIIVLVYFILRVMVVPMLKANKRKKFQLEEE